MIGCATNKSRAHGYKGTRTLDTGLQGAHLTHAARPDLTRLRVVMHCNYVLLMPDIGKSIPGVGHVYTYLTKFDEETTNSAYLTSGTLQ